MNINQKLIIMQKLPAGLMTEDYEFFTTIMDQVYFIHNGETKPIQELPFFVANEFIATINSEPKTKEILENWYPNNQQKQLEKFIGCRFGGLDDQPDFYANNTVGCGDNWNCPKRKYCLGDGIVCQPLSYNGKQISKIERELILLLITEDTNEVIANKLDLAFGTFHKIKKDLYAKLNCLTKQKLTKIAFELNIL